MIGYRQGSACLCAQILLQVAESCPVGGASCLSADYTWRQLVPDFAALAHSVCMALVAWPKDVPKPALYTNSGEIVLHRPLGLQFSVRPLLSACSLRVPSPALVTPIPGTWHSCKFTSPFA